MPDEPNISPARKAAIEAKAKRIADAKALAEKRDGLKKNVGQSFTDGEVTANVSGFEPDQNIKGVVADAFLVNFGNPNNHKYIHCDEFLAEFQPSKGAV